ncbi:BolA/IbaG family iron-sulfur metabolism protein [Wolbachia endosymbiont of Pentidionis agamae]|uniref:BolA/IbaG family iron-sulfur metabolism protein n=1 Tax=Wolbachia endosymbiont of Pentidionis agamae TaxID=3110435 RepID=UPI002FD72EDD
MPIKIYELEEIIKKSFPGADIEIKDLAGDNDHYYLRIVSKSFSNKTRVQQNKMVYQVLNTKNIHALQLETRAE